MKLSRQVLAVILGAQLSVATVALAEDALAEQQAAVAQAAQGVPTAQDYIAALKNNSINVETAIAGYNELLKKSLDQSAALATAQVDAKTGLITMVVGKGDTIAAGGTIGLVGVGGAYTYRVFGPSTGKLLSPAGTKYLKGALILSGTMALLGQISEVGGTYVLEALAPDVAKHARNLELTKEALGTFQQVILTTADSVNAKVTVTKVEGLPEGLGYLTIGGSAASAIVTP